MGSLPIEYRLSGIHILAKNVVELSQPFPPTAIFNFNIAVETRVQADARAVMPFVTVILTEVEKGQILASFKAVYAFQVENFVEAIKLNDQGIYAIPPELEVMIRAVAISTTRGIIYSELRGTYLHNAIMPVVMVDALQEQQKPIHAEGVESDQPLAKEQS